MKDFYVTFGQQHVHRINNHTFDADIVVVIEAESREKAHDRAFELFGAQWAFLYEELPRMQYFPRGLFRL